MKLTTPSPRILAALLLLAVVAVYAPALGAGYIWDDDALLTENPLINAAGGLGQIWRGIQVRDYTPVTLTSFWIEWRLWGAAPAGYHLVNVLLHAGSAILLWCVLRLLRVPGAWLAALLFGIHPVNVASVAWVAERKNTLSGLFFFASILCYLLWREKRRSGFYAGALALFALAALSKGSVVTLPAVLLLCVLWRDRRVTWRDALGVLPFAACAAAAAALTVIFQARAYHYGVQPGDWAYRVERAGAVTWMYLGALVWPAGMSPMQPPWHASWLPAAALAAVAALLVWKRRIWGGAPLFALTYYMVMLLPVLGFVWMTLMQETPSADWWQYAAAPGLFALAAAGADMAARRWRGAALACCLPVIALAGQTWRRAEIYRSPASYCVAVTEENPYAWTLQNNLGVLLKKAGRYPKAEACFRRALEANPWYFEAHINWGNMLAAQGEFKGAQSQYEAALGDALDKGTILHSLSGVLVAQGLVEQGIAREQQAVDEHPGEPMRWWSLAMTLDSVKRPDAAEQAMRKAISLAPGEPRLLAVLCKMEMAHGKWEAAAESCSKLDQLAATSHDPEELKVAAQMRKYLAAHKQDAP